MTRSSSRPEQNTTTTRSQTNPQLENTTYEAPNTRKKRLRDSLELQHPIDTYFIKKRKASVCPDDRVRPVQCDRDDNVSDTITVAYEDNSHSPRTTRQHPPASSASDLVDAQPSLPLIPTQNQTLEAARTANLNVPTSARTHTVHHDKVVAGLKHELDRLQPAARDRNAGDEKRKLRSQESTRYKSELSLYFSDYDVIIGNDQREKHVLNEHTPIVITDSQPPPSRTFSPGKIRIPKTPSRLPPKSYPAHLYTSLHQTEIVDFSVIQADMLATPILSDPFQHPAYHVAHKRQERLERSIRNTEKGRAQHERDQVIRLLETLESGDWLKCMGVTGITESRRKDFLDAREHFMKGCKDIIQKFVSWKEKEKRQKEAKDRLLLEGNEEDDVENDDQDDSASDGDPPDYSDIDHAAAKQLHEEAISRLRGIKSSSHANPHLVQQEELKSFYKKPHLREAALDTKRRSTRGATAFGAPLPPVQDRWFEPPAEILEFKDKGDERLRRREKRVSK